jgi:hypothetical protein
LRVASRLLQALSSPGQKAQNSVLGDGCTAGQPVQMQMDKRTAQFVLQLGKSAFFRQYFLLRCYRRWGVGTEAARQIWNRLPGPWEVRVMDGNKGAYQFWAHAIKTAPGQEISPVQVEIASRYWHVFTFGPVLDCRGEV